MHRIKRTKILIIAGGGIFGCIPAHFLSMLPSDKQTMNGIAFNKDKVYITGKYWDKVFEFSLKEKSVLLSAQWQR